MARRSHRIQLNAFRTSFDEMLDKPIEDRHPAFFKNEDSCKKYSRLYNFICALFDGEFTFYTSTNIGGMKSLDAREVVHTQGVREFMWRMLNMWKHGKTTMGTVMTRDAEVVSRWVMQLKVAENGQRMVTLKKTM